jgi:transposase
LACFSADISTKTGYRWYSEQQLTGRVEPSRFRKSIPGVMMQRDQDILFIIVKRNPTYHYDEYADSFFEETGHAYSTRQILL